MKFNQAFWKWFGDSKVVDSKGKPLVVYHGTDADITEFLKDKRGDSPDSKEAFFFTDSKKAAAVFALAKRSTKNSIIATYLRIERPLVVDAKNKRTILSMIDDRQDNVSQSLAYRVTQNRMTLSSTTVRQFGLLLRLARDNNYDGVVIPFSCDEDLEGTLSFYKDVCGATAFCVFEPTQIKSATGNDGTWDADDPDIRSNPSEDAMLVGIDDIPKSTQSDIMSELGERSKEFDTDDINSLLFDLVHPPMVVLWTPNPQKMKSQFSKTRGVSRAGVKPLLALLERGIELDPILTADGKFLDGGHRVTAYVEAGRDYIPAIDIGHLIRMNLRDWHDGILADESLLKEAQKVANKLR